MRNNGDTVIFRYDFRVKISFEKKNRVFSRHVDIRKRKGGKKQTSEAYSYEYSRLVSNAVLRIQLRLFAVTFAATAGRRSRSLEDHPNGRRNDDNAGRASDRRL